MNKIYGSILSLLALSCASYPPPSAHLASAIAAARVARESGATRVPRAALQLKLADEQIVQAQQMVQNGDNERADYMTLRAYNDAELALALTRQEAAQKRAEQLQAMTTPAATSNSPENGQAK